MNVATPKQNITRLRENPLAIAFLLALGPAIAQGFARFAYAILLPSMKMDMGWSYGAAGAMNTANAAGYLLGAVLTPFANGRLGERRVFLIGSWLSVVMLLLCGTTSAYGLLWALRFASGLFGAWVFISGAALVSANTDKNSAAGAISIYFAGVGIGITLTGAVLPFYLAAVGQTGWHTAWVGLGFASAVLSLMTGAIVPSLRDATVRDNDSTLPKPGISVDWSIFRPLRIALIAYFLWGAGYITYMTFIIAYVQRNGGGATIAALLWCVLGGTTVASPLFWKRAIERGRGGLPMATMVAVAMVGSALPLLTTAPVVMVLSALLLGASFMPVVAAITALTRRAVPANNFSFAVAFLTVLFAAGQTVGPYVSGILSDRFGLSAGLFESVLVLLLSGTLAFLQQSPEVS